jgi:hypothetical protein
MAILGHPQMQGREGGRKLHIRERGIKEKPLMRQVIYVKGLSFHFLFSANKQNFASRSTIRKGLKLSILSSPHEHRT